MLHKVLRVDRICTCNRVSWVFFQSVFTLIPIDLIRGSVSDWIRLLYVYRSGFYFVQYIVGFELIQIIVKFFVEN